MKTVIGTFYKDKELALKKLEEKNRLFKNILKNKFVLVEFSNGFLVVNKRQLK